MCRVRRLQSRYLGADTGVLPSFACRVGLLLRHHSLPTLVCLLVFLFCVFFLYAPHAPTQTKALPRTICTPPPGAHGTPGPRSQQPPLPPLFGFLFCFVFVFVVVVGGGRGFAAEKPFDSMGCCLVVQGGGFASSSPWASANNSCFAAVFFVWSCCRCGCCLGFFFFGVVWVCCFVGGLVAWRVGTGEAAEWLCRSGMFALDSCSWQLMGMPYQDLWEALDFSIIFSIVWIPRGNRTSPNTPAHPKATVELMFYWCMCFGLPACLGEFRPM